MHAEDIPAGFWRPQIPGRAKSAEGVSVEELLGAGGDLWFVIKARGATVELLRNFILPLSVLAQELLRPLALGGFQLCIVPILVNVRVVTAAAAGTERGATASRRVCPQIGPQRGCSAIVVLDVRLVKDAM